MEYERYFHLIQGEIDAYFVVIFWCTIEPQEQPFIDPVDNHKVYGGNQKQNWKAGRVHKCDPDDGNNLSQPCIDIKFRSNVKLFIVRLQDFPGSLFVARAASIPEASSSVINELAHRNNVRGRNLKNHSNYNLSPDLYVPHAREVLIVTLQDTHGQTLTNFHAHFDNKHNETQVNELDPTDGPNSLGNNLLFVDWSCETRSVMDQDFNKNVSQDD